MKLCLKPIHSTSKYAPLQPRLCHLPKGHKGRCEEMPFLDDLKTQAPRVAQKISRDATMTTGAAWKSSDAGPNRILRWAMMEDDETLLHYGLDMSALKPGIVAKLREKAADYDSCIMVAAELTWLAYQMKHAPICPNSIRAYLEELFGPMNNTTTCVICGLPLDFNDFNKARRGKAEIETCHKNPRLHSPANVGFGHRECNIAQGDKTLDEFYEWIYSILERVGYRG